MMQNDATENQDAEAAEAAAAESGATESGATEVETMASEALEGAAEAGESEEDGAPLAETSDPDGGASGAKDAARAKRAIFGVPIEVVVAVGRAAPSIGEMLNMRRDALLRLDTKIDDPVDIMVGKRVIARGELQEIEDGEGQLGVRLTEIVDLSEPF